MTTPRKAAKLSDATWDWRDHAACKDGKLTSMFFDPTRELEAKDFCNSKCAVIGDCREFALSTNTLQDDDGVWGGLSGRERRTYRHNRYRRLRNERSA